MNKFFIILFLFIFFSVISLGVFYIINSVDNKSLQDFGKIPKHTIYKQPVPMPASKCDPSLWNHVYAGDPKKFNKPQDRLTVIDDCKTVTGILETAKKEKDGDWHLRLKLNQEYKNLLNQYNVSGQKGDLVLEPVCENKPITQKDVIKEGVCEGYTGYVYNPSFLGKHVKVTGSYVEDEEHHWREIHPVTSIEIIK